MEPIVGGPNVRLSRLICQGLIVRLDGGKVFVITFESPWRRSMKQFWSDRHVSLGSKSVGDVADMRVNSERLLKNDQPGMWAAARGSRDVCGHRRCLWHLQFDTFFYNRALIHDGCTGDCDLLLSIIRTAAQFCGLAGRRLDAAANTAHPL